MYLYARLHVCMYVWMRIVEEATWVIGSVYTDGWCLVCTRSTESYRAGTYL